MEESKSHPGRTIWPFVLSAVTYLASGSALAQVSTTSSVPLTYFVVQQPVDVCSDTGTNCAFINNRLQTVVSSPTGADTFAAFIDPATGMLAERNDWSAASIDVRQTPVVQYNSTASQTINIDGCNPPGGTTNCTSASFSALAQQPAISTMTNPPTPPNVPTFPRNPDPTIINRFFVLKICSPTNTSCIAGDVDGFGALNGNAFATQNRVFFPQLTGKPDTDAHEKGHNLALDHTTFGAGGSTNLMTAGGLRTIPGPVPPPGSNMAAWVTEVSPNASPPSSLDELTTGGSCTSLTDVNCDNQQGAALLSGFLNASPQASTSLFPPEIDGGASIASTSPQSNPSTPPPIDFFIGAGIPSFGTLDACKASDICKNAYLAEAVIVLTQGKFDNSSGHSFQQFSNTQVLAGLPQIFHGNSGNEACESQGPTRWCLDLPFLPGAITVANQGFLDFTIGTKPSTIDGLQGNVCYFWNTAAGVPYYNSCADLLSLFGGLISDSRMVNLAINLLIPLDFAGTPGNKPCTIIPPATTCPDPTHTYPID